MKLKRKNNAFSVVFVAAAAAQFVAAGIIVAKEIKC
jgi:hypothetical protein